MNQSEFKTNPNQYIALTNHNRRKQRNEPIIEASAKRGNGVRAT